MKDWYNKDYFDRLYPYESKGINIKKKIRTILKLKPRNLLDVGCGHGFVVLKLREYDIEAIGMDWSENAGKLIPDWFMRANALQIPAPDQSFDVVFSSDFFEHLPEEEIDQVAEEMKRVGKIVLAIVCFKKDRVGRGKTDTHLTMKPRGWWVERLKGIDIINQR